MPMCGVKQRNVVSKEWIPLDECHWVNTVEIPGGKHCFGEQSQHTDEGSRYFMGALLVESV